MDYVKYLCSSVRSLDDKYELNRKTKDLVSAVCQAAVDLYRSSRMELRSITGGPRGSHQTCGRRRKKGVIKRRKKRSWNSATITPRSASVDQQSGGSSSFALAESIFDLDTRATTSKDSTEGGSPIVHS